MGNIFGRITVAIASVLLAIVTISSSSAQSMRERNSCLGKYSETRYERLIVCAAIVEAGQGTPEILSALHTLRADALSDNRVFVDAIREYDQALQLNSNNTEAYCGRGITFAHDADIDRAIADFDQAARLGSANPKCWNARAMAYWRKGDAAQAISDLTTAIKLNPRDADAFFNRAMAFEATNELVRAIADFDRVIRFMPDDAAAYYNRGQAKLKLGDLAGGNADIVRAQELGRKIGPSSDSMQRDQ